MPANIVSIVFSKDRAMQLDAMLSSFFANCIDPDLIRIFVLYTVSSGIHAKQYQEIIREYRDKHRMSFVVQNNFQKDVLSLLGMSVKKRKFSLKGLFGSGSSSMAYFPRFVMFMVDDNIFVRKFRLSEAISALDHEKDTLGFAMQLGENINYCYPLDIPIEFPPSIQISDNCIKYRWVNAEDGLNYPLEVSSSIYRTVHMAKILPNLDFLNPNLLEAGMASMAKNFQETQPYLACYRHSVTFCNPANKVQSTFDNKSGEVSEYQSQNMAQLFSNGYRIDIQPYQGFLPISCHQEVPFHFVEKEKD